jgi:hypothetical protein
MGLEIAIVAIAIGGSLLLLAEMFRGFKEGRNPPMKSEEYPILEPEVIEEVKGQKQDQRPEERVDEMPQELQELFGLAEEQPPGVIETWVENVRERYSLRQRQRTLQEQAQFYQLQAESDLHQAGALEARTELLVKRLALGLVSPQSRVYLERHLPELWQQVQEEAELRQLGKEVQREELLTQVAEKRAQRAKFERAADYSKLGYYFAKWEELIGRLRGDLRGTAEGMTGLLKELKRIVNQIESDQDLTPEERTWLKQRLEQEFRNLAATWGKRS